MCKQVQVTLIMLALASLVNTAPMETTTKSVGSIPTKPEDTEDMTALPLVKIAMSVKPTADTPTVKSYEDIIKMHQTAVDGLRSYNIMSEVRDFLGTNISQ